MAQQVELSKAAATLLASMDEDLLRRTLTREQLEAAQELFENGLTHSYRGAYGAMVGTTAEGMDLREQAKALLAR